MIARIPEKLQSKEPYTPVTAGYSIRLDANESPYNVSAELREDMKRALDDIDFNRYPDPLAADLCKAFARAYGIRSSYVTAGNGSDELIGLILSSFLEKGEGVTVALPDFSMYAFYASLSEEKLHVFKRDGAPTLDGLRAFVRETGSAAVIFSNPCNPTGQGYDRKSVLQFVLSTDALCIIDEAYMDFWDQSILADAPWLENAFVLRTLSKVFGAAALRLGFAVANAKLTAALRTAKSPYNVNAVSQAFGKLLLERRDADRSAELAGAARRLRKALLPYFPGIPETVTNFVYIETPQASAIAAYLASRGIAVRVFPNALRITAGSGAENDALLAALRDYFAK